MARRFPRAWVFADPAFPIAVRAPHRMRDAVFDRHHHDFCELTVILAGSGTHVTEHSEWSVTAGDVFVTLPGQVHGYRDAAGMVRQIVCYGHEVLLAPEAAALRALPGYRALFDLEPQRPAQVRGSGRLRLADAELARLAGLLSQMVSEQESAEAGAATMLRALFLQTVVLCSRAFDADDTPAGRGLVRVARVLAWIEQHLAEPITLADLAQVAGVSAPHLRRLFRSAVGSSPQAAVLGARLRRAADLLTTSDESITAIAFHVGFNDSNYFARQFRQVMGTSPSDWRLHR